MHVVDVGDDAVLVVVADVVGDAATDQVLGLWRALTWAAPHWLIAAQPAYLSVHVVFDGSVDVGVVRAFLSSLRPRARAGEARVVDVPVVYDGEDLAFVAEFCGVSVDDVIARHAAARYRVAFNGFVKGFSYLMGLDEKLRGVPRLPAPRTRVPALSVGLVGDQTGVYPSSTPGGWRLIGRALQRFDAAPDDVVRFVAVDSAPAAEEPKPQKTTPLRIGGAIVSVDGGHARIVRGGGALDDAAFDDHALAIANALVGHGPNEAAVEVTMGRLRIAAQADVLVGGIGIAYAALSTGQTGTFPLLEFRATVAVAPGQQYPPRDGLDAALLDGGDRHLIRIVAGADGLDEAFAEFVDVDWRVSPQSSRLGVRLEGKTLTIPEKGTDVVTRGTWTGAIQVTSSGQPIVLGPDQRRTGGYAELGRVIAVDRWKLAHAKPGSTLRFTAVDVEAARVLLRQRHEAQRRRR